MARPIVAGCDDRLWIVFGFLVYGVVTGIVWLTYGGFPRWYGVAVAVVVVIVGVPALVLSGSQF